MQAAWRGGVQLRLNAKVKGILTTFSINLHSMLTFVRG